MTPEPTGPAAGPQDAQHVLLSRAQRLVHDAAEAAEVRAYQTHPDVVALRIEHVRAQVDRLCWAGICLGLAFTMTNVAVFAAAGAPAWSLPWLAAWVLDPTVSLVLLAILRGEQVTARYQVRTGVWVRVAKWFTLAATYVMNTWASYADGSLSGVVLHSVPPLLVFVAAEVVTDLRDKLTDAVTAAVNAAVGAADARTATGGHMGLTSVHGVHERVSGSGEGRPARRRTFEEYRQVARHVWSPGVEITPTWVRQVTGCSAGLSSRLARALAADVAAVNGAVNGAPDGGGGRR
jgi:hypothetical protein